jgi:hypothetical protein
MLNLGGVDAYANNPAGVVPRSFSRITVVVDSVNDSLYYFVVQSRPDLSSGSSWTTLPNMPALVGTNWQVSVPSTGAPQFFQLVYQ